MNKSQIDVSGYTAEIYLLTLKNDKQKRNGEIGQTLIYNKSSWVKNAALPFCC